MAYKIHLPTFYGSKIPVGILNMHFKFNICKKTQKKVKSQGMTNIEEMSKNDLTVLSNMLAEKEVMFGDDPSMLDMVVYSHLAQLIMVESEYPCPLRDFLQESCKNLVGLVKRIRRKKQMKTQNLKRNLQKRTRRKPARRRKMHLRKRNRNSEKYKPHVT